MTYRKEARLTNDLSRNRADHHREPWTEEEQEILRSFWDGTDETLAEIAETLGRTIEACRQRWYYPVGQPRDHSTRHQNGWMVGFCTNCGQFGDVFCTGLIQECEDCRC